MDKEIGGKEMKEMRHIIMMVVVGLMAAIGARAQDDVLMSQYMHNQFAINSAFAGSRGGLTAFASVRKQWTGVEGSPMSILFTTHTPLRNKKLAIGLSAVNQTILETSTTGVQATIAYRIRMGSASWLSFALQPGFKMIKTDWTKMKVYHDSDDAFAESETKTSPTAGVGIALYGAKYYLGVSVQSLLLSSAFDTRKPEWDSVKSKYEELSEQQIDFDPANATYYATAGYEFGLGDYFTLQPSAMVQYSKRYGTQADLTLTPGWDQMIYLELGYRTTGVMLGGISFRPKSLQQLKIAYTYEMTTGDFSGYNTGSHEISISYDFVYRLKNIGPRFF